MEGRPAESVRGIAAHNVESEKLLEIDFVNGKPVRVSDQFGKGAKR